MNSLGTDWNALIHDPLVRAFLDRQRKNLGQVFGAPSVRTPQQVVGEQRSIAISLRLIEERAEREGRVGRSLAEDVLRAVPFLWLNDIDPFITSFTLPRHVIGSDIMPHDRCWWTFEGGHPIIDTQTGARLGLADGFLIIKSGPTFDVAVIGSPWPLDPTKPGGLMTSARFRVGQRWPDDIPLHDRASVREVLARLAFLNAPFVEAVVQRPHPKHHGARRIQPSPEGVRFVRLRPAIDESTGHVGASTSVTEWRHRWMVRGHLRAQWYPKAQEHRLIWVSPYAKGPSDKPFKAPVYAVVR